MTNTTNTPKAATVDLKLEIVVIPVSDVERAKQFYEARLAARRRPETVSVARRAFAHVLTGP